MKHMILLVKPEIYFRIRVVSVHTWLSPVLKKKFSHKDECACQLKSFHAEKKSGESMLDISWCF